VLLQSTTLSRVAEQLDAPPMQVGLAYAPRLSLARTRNLGAASVTLPPDAIRQLDAVDQIQSVAAISIDLTDTKHRNLSTVAMVARAIFSRHLIKPWRRS
jgi:hypothetical protein